MFSPVLARRIRNFSICNKHGVEVVNLQASKNKDSLIGLSDRYDDPGGGGTGKQ
jgi:hypothetical protein